MAQANLGYKNVSQTLEALNIEPGFFCEVHTLKMDKKSSMDKERKSTHVQTTSIAIKQTKDFRNLEERGQRGFYVGEWHWIESGHLRDSKAVEHF